MEVGLLVGLLLSIPTAAGTVLFVQVLLAGCGVFRGL